MKRNTTLILTFLFSGLILIGVAFLVSKWLDQTPATPPIATIEKISDSVFILRKHLTQKESLGRKALLHELESIESGPDGDAVLDFPNGFRIRVLSNTEVTLDKEFDKTLVYLKAGDLRIETMGREDSLFIIKNGVRMTAADYDKNFRDLTETPKYQERPVAEGLTPSYLVMVLSAQKGSFYKCYTQLLQKNPKLTGEASISITIEPSGKVSRTEISSSQLEDNSFKRCLTEVTQRIEFKPFVGKPVTTVFPVKFE